MKKFHEPADMSKPQAKVAVILSSEWIIRRPFVFRYLDKLFVDQFFSDGTLRLSSFSAFAKHEDEERLDSAEGLGVLENTNQEGEGQSLSAALSQGHDAYVLCGSTIYSETLAEAFQANSGFRINDPTAFGVSVAQSIPGFRGGREGACIYADGKIVKRQAGKLDLESMRVSPEGKAVDMGKLFGAVFGMVGDDLYFLKNRKYKHQAEYRLLWGTNKLHGDSIKIQCPDAVQFCTRFEEL